MSDDRIILVTGATGSQGGGVARHLLSDSGFSVRCLTRNPDSDSAADLRRAGADVVRGDLEDRPSIQEALEGCYGCFGVTNYWEHFEAEFRHGRNLIDAVDEADIKHFVFSTLPPVEKASGGELKSPHFDLKAELEQETRNRRIPATFTHVAFYYQNFIHLFPPQKDETGAYVFGFPQGDTPLAGVDVEDVGGVVAAIFNNPSENMGQVIGVVGDDLPPAEYAAIMTRVLGVTVRFKHVEREAFAALGFPGADDLADMFDFNRRFISNRAKDVEDSRRLYPAMKRFEQWAAENKEQLLAALK